MDDDKELETALKQYPSNFDLYDEAKLMPKDYIEKVKGKLVLELDSDPYDTSMETLRAWNLISFLNFILGNEKEAFDYNSKVLELSKDNIIGLCNKAWFLLKMQEKYNVVKDLCKELKDHFRNRNKALIAKAEKAFCYSRFGIKRYEKSRQLFEEVLEAHIQCTESHQRDSSSSQESDDAKQSTVQTDNFCVWNFGYALTFQRALNFNNAHDMSSIDLSKKAIEKVCDLYCRIIHMKADSKCILRYQARSYVELGSLVYNVRKNKSRFPNGIKDILLDHKDLWMYTEQFYLKAISLCPCDVFVLERSGRYFRYVNDLPKSIELLGKAIEIRGTAFSHHHLALTLKRKLEKQSNPTTTPHTQFVVPKEKQNVSRNILSKFEEVKDHIRPPKSEDKIYALPKATTPTMNKSNVTDDNSHISKQKECRQKIPHKTHIQTPSSCDKNIQRVRLQCSGSNPNACSSFSQMDDKIRGNVSDDKEFEEVRSMLEQTSLDSGYESMPALASNMSVENRENETHVKSKQVHESSKFLNAATGEGLHYKNQRRMNRGRGRGRSPYRNYSSIRQNEQTRLYNDYRNDDFRAVKRGRRKSHRHPQRKCNDRMTFAKMIKSPQKPQFINKDIDEETIDQIILHLDKSVELSNNCGAIYDKGILYRQIGENDKALSTFKSLIRNEGGYCSLVQLSNAFEQSGLCLYDILSQSEEDQSCKQDDMRMYFKKSIEISCSIVSKIPFLKDCWVSAPTLQDFLSGKARTSEYLKDLVFLKKKFENYGEVINILKELKDVTAEEEEKTKIDIQIVENYVSNGSYDDAVLALDAIACLQNGYELIEEKLYLQAHIDGGIDALKQGYYEMARLRLRNALDFHRHNQVLDEFVDTENDTAIEEESFDIFILCNEKIEEKVKQLEQMLTCFRLRVTINLLDLLPGSSKMSGICQQFERSKHFLLVLDDKPLGKIVEHYFGMMQEVVFNRNNGHIVIIKVGDDTKVPKFLSKYPNIEMDFETADGAKAFYENDSVCKVVRTLLFKLASS